jgi:serpin B
VASDSTLDQAYLDSTRTNFLAELVSTDFGASEEARSAINTWVESQTNSKIKDLLAKGVITGNTKMVLINAIYFKGDWETKFDKYRTCKSDFHVNSDQTVRVDMMHSSQKFGVLGQIKELNGASALEMPYKGERAAWSTACACQRRKCAPASACQRVCASECTSVSAHQRVCVSESAH